MPDEERLEPGLYLVATPIGNLGDISHRAAETLREVERLYAEDTRHSRRLMEHLGINRQLFPCHEHNEEALAADITRAVAAGGSCGLITDAGTPGISDPGFRVVRACRKAGLPVIPIPGPNAAVAALSVSGLPTDRFFFLGFLPPKSAARRRTFEEWKKVPATLVFYESTHRIEKFMADAVEVLGPDRVGCLARQLTKQHETVLTGPLQEIREQLARGSTKGEFVIMIAKKDYIL